MGRQVSIILHPDDEADFEQFLRSCGDVVFVPEIQSSATWTTVPDTLTTKGEDVSSGRLFMVRPADAEQIELSASPNRDYWIVKEDALPVVHFDRCGLQNDRIGIGRLYFKTSSVRDGAWVEHPRDFVQWGDRLLRGTRKRLTKFEQVVAGAPYKALIGPAALAWQKENDAGFRPWYLALIAARAVE